MISMPSPVYQCKNALRLNMAENYVLNSATKPNESKRKEKKLLTPSIVLLNSSWMAVELESAVADYDRSEMTSRFLYIYRE